MPWQLEPKVSGEAASRRSHHRVRLARQGPARGKRACKRSLGVERAALRSSREPIRAIQHVEGRPRRTVRGLAIQAHPQAHEHPGRSFVGDVGSGHDLVEAELVEGVFADRVRDLSRNALPPVLW